MGMAGGRSVFRFIKSNEFGSRVKTMDKKTKPDAGTSGYLSDFLETQKDKGTFSKHNQQL